MDYDLDKAIRKIPDFPKPGILFYDITGILTLPEAFRECMNQIISLYKDEKFDAVAAVESRGFVFAAPLALALGLPLLLVRKQGKLPGKVLSRSYSLEYGKSVLEVKPEDVPLGGNVLLVDDLLATGGTLKAAAELLEEAGALVKDVFCVVGLPFLNPAQKLEGRRIRTLIDYHGE
ncbi:MAG: adenine phosphoribosyltransferase [Spirochaetes bacterium GWB1_48_6]|nr:MAG: adenine phosphoribosyltransferase [Spirochaetes bacterium GWB1_48_6]